MTSIPDRRAGLNLWIVAVTLALSTPGTTLGEDATSLDVAGKGASRGAGAWQFVDITASAGINIEYIYVPDRKPVEPRWICGGAAAGDVDDDGFVDLYMVGGELGSNIYYRNKGDGTFEDLTVVAGVAIDQVLGCGPLFVDLDGDGDDDLLVPSVQGAPRKIGQAATDEPASYPRIFSNQGDGTFVDVSDTMGFQTPHPSYSPAFADIDGDGDLDGFLSRWRYGSDDLLWRHHGGTFSNDSVAWLGQDPGQRLLYSFTPNFADLDGDRRPDLVVASDFGNSRVFLNRNGLYFEDMTSAVISDENGMGGSVGDVDNDGDLDWFVSSIWDPSATPDGNWGITGNRLYRNLGDGSFEDATESSGVREGYWGWGSCFADFDNDGDLDLFHVNGFRAPSASDFADDPARLFLNDGTGVFSESSASLGVDDTGQGRGVVCFDLERDGDIDILIAQNAEPSTLLRNDLPAGAHYLTVALAGETPNPRGIGARIEVVTGALEQMREIQAGSNFISQSPAEAHFGLGANPRADILRVLWPDGRDSQLGGVAADQRLTISIEAIFLDGFEAGSTDAWTTAVGKTLQN